MQNNVIQINGKFLSRDITGVERYANSLINEFISLGFKFNILKPKDSFIVGKYQNIWEQFIPYKMNGNLLFCPTNTGPINYKNKILTLHDAAVLSHPEWFSKYYSTIRKIMIPKLINSSLKIITVSDFSKNHICDRLNIDETKIEVIHNGVDIEKFKPMGISNKVLKKYNLEKPFLLSVGSIEPRKNLKRIINSWMKLPKIYRDEFDLIIIGKKNEKFRETFIQEDNSIKNLGYVSDDDLITLYSMAHIFLYPSLFEGFGLPILEAMSCGAPVITSNYSALPEVGGNSVLYVDPKNEDNIASKIAELLDNDDMQKDLKIKGIEQSKLFSWNSSAKKTIKLLNKYI